METIVLWCGFVGAWLLVAGPIYQAALELSEERERVQFEHWHEARKKLPAQREASAWWWLLPPIKIYLERKYSNEYRRQFIAALPPEDVALMINFMNKATAWLYVATGGFLIAIKETYELGEHLEFGTPVIIVAAVILAVLSVLNTALRMARSQKIINSK